MFFLRLSNTWLVLNSIDVSYQGIHILFMYNKLKPRQYLQKQAFKNIYIYTNKVFTNLKMFSNKQYSIQHKQTALKISIHDKTNDWQ